MNSWPRYWIATGLALATVTATAQTYSFTQAFSGGSLVQGNFSGKDLNGDGRLDSRDQEVTQFSVSFSGSPQLVSFSLGLIDLRGLVYDIGTPVLGDAAFEGIVAETLGGVGFSYVTGRGPTTFQIGSVGALPFVPGQNVSTDLPVYVAVVPEPSTALLLVLGLYWLALHTRRCLTPRSS